MTALFDAHAPLQTVRVTRPKSPWFTDALRNMKKERNKLFAKYKKSGCPNDWSAYKKMRNLFTQAVRNEKKSYIEFVVRNKKSKDVWQTLAGMNVYNKSKNSFNMPTFIKDPNIINQSFLDLVKNVAPPADNSLINKYSSNCVSASRFSFSPVSDDDISNVIRQIKSNAIGFDGLSLEMIKLCCPVIVPFLAHIFNCCLVESLFPDQWKTALILPLPKVTDVQSVTDLRPISLLPVVSKIFEKIIYSQIIKYLLSNNLLPDTQSGFRKQYSTASVLLKVTDDIIQAADNKETSALVLLDFSKAFDTLDHQLLCAKLHYYGFTYESIKFFDSYLSGRTQRVLLDGKMSHSLLISRGVPQGSILGPMLFLIYTSDMEQAVTGCGMQRYADDTQLHIKFNIKHALETAEAINECLDNVFQYSKKNGLKLNPSKSAVLFFGPNKDWAAEHLIITVNNVDVPVVNEYKNLGVMFDTNLRFKAHVSKVVQKSIISLKNLYKNKHVLNVALRRQLCESLVLSHCNYADVVYGPCLDVQSKTRLQRIQNSCIRFIFNLRFRDHVSHRLSDLRWLNMGDRLKLHLGCLLHRLLESETPKYLRDKLTHRIATHDRNTRNNYLLNIPRHRTALFRRSFSYVIPKLFNSEIRNRFANLGYSLFKRNFKDYLLSK